MQYLLSTEEYGMLVDRKYKDVASKLSHKLAVEHGYCSKCQIEDICTKHKQYPK